MKFSGSRELELPAKAQAHRAEGPMGLLLGGLGTGQLSIGTVMGTYDLGGFPPRTMGNRATPHKV